MDNKQQPIIVGLDIGTTKVVAIAGRKNQYGKLDILGFGRADSEGVDHGVVINIEQCVRSVQKALTNCLASNPNLVINEVYVGIAGRHIKSRQSKGSKVRANLDTEISKEDIDELLRDQFRTFRPSNDQIIDIIPQDYVVDNMPGIVNPVGMSGMKIEGNFHIVTGDVTAVRNIKRCVDRASLVTRDLMLQPIASAAAVMNDEDMEAGVAIVDIGGGTTDMAVFCDGVLKHTAVIPYAGVNITNDIVAGLRVLRSQAEQMKVQFGTALEQEASRNSYITIPGLRGLPPKEVSVSNLASIIQARMEEILDYVLTYIRQAGLENKLNGGIILTGGGAKLKHIVQLTEYITGMGARIGYPNEHLAFGHNEQLMSPMYSTCIGLILRGYYDFEHGKLEFAGHNGNLVKEEAPVVANPVVAPVAEDTTEDGQDEEQEEEEEEGADKQPKSVNEEKMKKRKNAIFEFIGIFKGKFMDFFEDTEDRELK